MRRKIITGIICGTLYSLLLTGCGTSEKNDEMSYDAKSSNVVNEISADEEYNDSNYMSDDNKAASDSFGGAVYDDASVDEIASNDGEKVNTTPTNNIKKEMLIYKGNIEFDTVDFDKSVAQYKKMLYENEGFIFSETYDVNKVSDKNKRRIYWATVRVPARNYDAVMNNASSIGEVRSLSSDVTNVTKRYSTASSELEIYEEEYERYLNMIKEAKTDEESREIQDKMLPIRLKIADLKSSMGDMETDVAYSYIDITIQEVEAIEEKMVDTFGDRFKEACKEAYEDTISNLQNLLIFVIKNLFGVVILLVIVIVIIVKLVKLRKKELASQNKNKKNKSNDTSGQYNQVAQDSIPDADNNKEEQVVNSDDKIN